MAEALNLKRRIFLRSILVSAGLLIFSIAIAVRIAYVQQVEGPEWKSRAENTRYRVIPASRGNIFSDDGSLLVTSVPEYRVGIDLSVTVRHSADSAHFYKNLDSLTIHLSQMLNDSPATIRKRILNARRKLLDVMAYNEAQTDTSLWKQEPRYLSISPKHITYEKKKWLFESTKWATIRKATKEEKLQDKALNRRVFRFKWMPMDSVKLFSTGLNFELVPNRDKPFRNTASRLLGKTDDIIIKDPNAQGLEVMRGVTGIEKSFDKVLYGQEGHGWFENLRGSWRPLNESEEHHPIPGLDLYTTLNINMQDVTEAALMKAVKHYKAKYGTAIVMDTKTGEIKAIANLHHTKDTTYVDDQNFAVNYRIAPGSTFKLATMMAVFEETNVSPNDMVSTTGQYLHLHDSNNMGYGVITIADAFMRSSNTGMARVLVQHFSNKHDKFIDYLEKFHLADKLGFQVEVSKGNETPEFHRMDHRLYSKKTLPTMSIGEEMRVSALQMLAFYNAVANDGYWVQPIVVKSAKRGDLVEIDYTKTQRRDTERICSERTLKIVRQMLEGVLESSHGTARSIRSSNYRIAGKTGTSKKFDGKLKTNKYYSSFIGYFPAENPRYTILVALDEPHNPETGLSAYGGTAAAPVFREIADKVHALDVQMHRTLSGKPVFASKWQEELGNSHPNDVQAIASSFQIKTNASGWDEAPRGSTRRVPNLKGMTLRDALYVLENRGYKVTYSGRGHVVSQSLEPGTEPADRRINLELH